MAKLLYLHHVRRSDLEPCCKNPERNAGDTTCKNIRDIDDGQAHPYKAGDYTNDGKWGGKNSTNMNNFENKKTQEKATELKLIITQKIDGDVGTGYVTWALTNYPLLMPTEIREQLLKNQPVEGTSRGFRSQGGRKTALLVTVTHSDNPSDTVCDETMKDGRKMYAELEKQGFNVTWLCDNDYNRPEYSRVIFNRYKELWEYYGWNEISGRCSEGSCDTEKECEEYQCGGWELYGTCLHIANDNFKHTKAECKAQRHRKAKWHQNEKMEFMHHLKVNKGSFGSEYWKYIEAEKELLEQLKFDYGLQNYLPGGDLYPSRTNIIKAMRKLGGEARDGDSLFFYYSGHGGERPDNDESGQLIDNVIFPADHEQYKNFIRDNEIYDCLVMTIESHNVSLGAMFDSCSSGDVMDLGYTTNAKGNFELKRFRYQNEKKEQQIRKVLETGYDPRVMLLSGCTQRGESAGDKNGGVFTNAFINALEEDEYSSLRNIFERTHELIKAGDNKQNIQVGSLQSNADLHLSWSAWLSNE